MLNCLGRALILAFWIGASPPSASALPFDLAAAEWEELKEKRGIRTFRWQPPGHDLFAFKGIGVIDAPIATVATLFADWTRMVDWVPDLVDARIVRYVSAVERVQYMLFETPFVVKDRDFVVRTRAHVDRETHVVRIEFHSVVDEDAPETENVRGRIVAGEYLLEPLAEDEKTRLTLQVYLDPKGSVPRWIVNRMQRSFPARTIGALRERCSRGDFPDHPLVRAVLDGDIDPESESIEIPTGF
jgi:hypothetical protein